MIPVPATPSRGDEQDRCPADVTPCIVCGKPCRNPQWMLHLYQGYYAISTEEAELMQTNDPRNFESSDSGMHPIGSGCLRKHPKLRLYVVRQ